MTDNKIFNKVLTFLIYEFEDGFEYQEFNSHNEEYSIQVDNLIFEHGYIKHVYVSVTPVNEE